MTIFRSTVLTACFTAVVHFIYNKIRASSCYAFVSV